MFIGLSEVENRFSFSKNSNPRRKKGRATGKSPGSRGLIKLHVSLFPPIPTTSSPAKTTPIQ
jgi:hypothetical protein